MARKIVLNFPADLDLMGIADVEIRFVPQLRAVMTSPMKPNSGVTMDEMHRTMRVLKALDEDADALVLEDADFDFVIQKLDAFRWPAVHPRLVAFDKAIREAETVSLMDAPAKAKQKT